MNEWEEERDCCLWMNDAEESTIGRADERDYLKRIAEGWIVLFRL